MAKHSTRRRLGGWGAALSLAAAAAAWAWAGEGSAEGDGDPTPREEKQEVRIEKLQYRLAATFAGSSWGEYVDAPDKLCVARDAETGTHVGFKAIPTTTETPWPGGKPLWTGEVVGTGEEKEKGYTEATAKDYARSAKAECGNTKEVKIQVADLSRMKIMARNMLNAKETQAYPVKAGEFMGMYFGGYRFTLDLNGWDEPVAMKWELWETHYLNDVARKGTGITAEPADLPSAPGVFDDECFIRFYSDVNATGDSTGYINDPKIDSPYFRPRLMEPRPLTIHYSFPNNQAPVNTVHAEEILNTRNSDADWRTVLSFPATTAAWPQNISILEIRPGVDGVADYDRFCQETESSPRGNVFMLERIDYFPGLPNGAAGFAKKNRSIALCWHCCQIKNEYSGDLLAHEWGHVAGLGHDATVGNGILNPSPYGKDALSKQQAEAYMDE